MALSQQKILLIGENYEHTLSQSVNQLLSETQNKTLNLPHFHNLFHQLIQSKIDPPVESIWVYSALSFKTKKSTESNDLSTQMSLLNDLFQHISGCSGPYSASKSIALLAPFVFELYNLVLQLLSNDLIDKKVKKCVKKVSSLIGDVLGYVSVCCSKGVSEDCELSLSVSVADLVSVWMEGSADLKKFFPLVSAVVCEEIIGGGGENVSYLSGVVVCEIFLLKLCLDFRVGDKGVELEKEMKSWAVATISGFQSFYFFDMLVRVLMEPTLPASSLLRSGDESCLRKVLYDAAILVEYSFLKPEQTIDLPDNYVRNLLMKRLIITHEAIEHFRKNGEQKRAISYTSSFSTSRLPVQIIKCVTSQIGMEEDAERLKGASPKALLKWLLNIESRGVRLFDDEISKLHAKLAVDDPKSDYEQEASKSVGKKIDADVLFYIDNKGADDDNHNEEDKEIDESMSAAFMAAAKTMRLIRRGGTKRKEGRSGGKKKKIKVLEQELSDDSDSDEEQASSYVEDGSGSESEVENPSSDEDV